MGDQYKLIAKGKKVVYTSQVYILCAYTLPVGSGLRAFGLYFMIGRNGAGELSILSAHLSWGRIMFVA